MHFIDLTELSGVAGGEKIVTMYTMYARYI